MKLFILDSGNDRIRVQNSSMVRTKARTAIVFALSPGHDHDAPNVPRHAAATPRVSAILRSGWCGFDRLSQVRTTPPSAIPVFPALKVFPFSRRREHTALFWTAMF